MKRILAALIVITTGCAKTQEFKAYKDPGGDFVLNVPADWIAESSPRKKPAAVTSFVSKKAVFEEGQPIGPILHVTKFYRTRDDHPGSGEEFEEFSREVLSPSDALFGAPADSLSERQRDSMKDARDMTLGGLPAKTYQKSFEMKSTPMHGNRVHSVKLEDVVVQTPSAYYVLEYRATQELFDKYYFAFQNAAQTFRILAAQ